MKDRRDRSRSRSPKPQRSNAKAATANSKDSTADATTAGLAAAAPRATKKEETQPSPVSQELQDFQAKVQEQTQAMEEQEDSVAATAASKEGAVVVNVEDKATLDVSSSGNADDTARKGEQKEDNQATAKAVATTTDATSKDENKAPTPTGNALGHPQQQSFVPYGGPPPGYASHHFPYPPHGGQSGLGPGYPRRYSPHPQWQYGPPPPPPGGFPTYSPFRPPTDLVDNSNNSHSKSNEKKDASALTTNETKEGESKTSSSSPPPLALPNSNSNSNFPPLYHPNPNPNPNRHPYHPPPPHPFYGPSSYHHGGPYHPAYFHHQPYYGGPGSGGHGPGAHGPPPPLGTSTNTTPNDTDKHSPSDAAYGAGGTAAGAFRHGPPPLGSSNVEPNDTGKHSPSDVNAGAATSPSATHTTADPKQPNVKGNNTAATPSSANSVDPTQINVEGNDEKDPVSGAAVDTGGTDIVKGDTSASIIVKASRTPPPITGKENANVPLNDDPAMNTSKSHSHRKQYDAALSPTAAGLTLPPPKMPPTAMMMPPMHGQYYPNPSHNQYDRDRSSPPLLDAYYPPYQHQHPPHHLGYQPYPPQPYSFYRDFRSNSNSPNENDAATTEEGPGSSGPERGLGGGPGGYPAFSPAFPGPPPLYHSHLPPLMDRTHSPPPFHLGGYTTGGPPPSMEHHPPPYSHPPAATAVASVTRGRPKRSAGVASLDGSAASGDDRKARKNAQSRARSAAHKQRLADIDAKPEWERTQEEQDLWQANKDRREHKNNQSRQRALQKKETEAAILAKPEALRTEDEVAWVEEYLSKRKRKHEGDRLRRERLKKLGISAKRGSGAEKPRISARGPLPPRYQAMLPSDGAPQQAAPQEDVPDLEL